MEKNIMPAGALTKLSEILARASKLLSDNPVDTYILRQTENEITKLSTEHPEPTLRFIDFLFRMLRHHIWVHVAGDASVEITDERSEKIIRSISQGLQKLSQSLSEGKEEIIFHALVDLTIGYLNELEKGE